MTQWRGDDMDWGTGSAFNWRTGGDAWSVNRLGTAAAATTAPGTPAAYGTAFDLAAAASVTADQFRDFARTIAESQQREIIALAERGIPADQHSRELEIAENYERYGLSMENSSFSNTDDDDEGFFTRFGNDLQTGFRMLRNTIGQGVHEGGELIGLNDDEAPDYETYVGKGGSLTESEWNSFSPATRNELFDRANMGRFAQHVAGTPGISHALYALDQSYRGVITGGDMLKNARTAMFATQENAAKGAFKGDLTALFDGSQWAAAWRASDDRSVGNMILDNLLSPKVSQETLDDWRKHNSWYQMSSVPVEFAATWYLDLGVIGARGAGNLARVARNEMPLNESGKMYAAIREAQQGREVISVRSAPAKQWARWRAERTTQGFDGMVDYAKAVDLRQFATLPAFRGRTAHGVAAAKAIHVAANSGDQNLIDLTRGALSGDLRSLRTIQEMKEDPSLASKYVNGTNFVQAWDATKMKANQLEDEIAGLEKRKVGENLSHFARWEIDTDIALKQREVDEMHAWLDADSDYKEWLSSIGTTGVRKENSAFDEAAVDPYNPQLERYGTPKMKWNETEQRFEKAGHRRFIPDVFARHHEFITVGSKVAARKVGVVSMHDLDSGQQGIERFFEQATHHLHLPDFDIDGVPYRQHYLERWTSAETNYDRYKVMYDMEEEVLIPALANRLGISNELAGVVFHKIHDERKRTFEGITYGTGRMYDTAPTFAQRLQDDTGGTARLLSKNDDGTVTFELRDGQRLVTATVPEGMLTPRVKPVDPTQTPNYYQPTDIRRLYLEAKRHKDVLDDLDVNLARRGSAALAETNEILATKFYSFWKPLQLWRLGWPQRVLMDEGFRAMAIFGPMYWITGPGAESIGTAVGNTPAFIRDKYRAHKHGKVVLTDGPLAPRNKADDAFEWATEAQKAVRLPADEFPKVNPGRFERLMKMNVEAGKAIDYQTRMLAVHNSIRHMGESLAVDKQPSGITGLVAREREMYDGNSPTMDEYEKWAPRYDNPEKTKAFEEHPLRVAYRDAQELGHHNAIDYGALVYDPVSGKRIKQGYFVPLPNLGHKVASGLGSVEKHNLVRWAEQNQELLARRGIRVQIDGNEVKVGLWFNNKQRRKAEAAMRRVAETLPVGQQRWTAWNLGKAESIEVTDVNDMSTFMESIEQYFLSEEVKVDGPGVIPTTEGIDGKVYHGTGSELPSELQPREDVIMENGQMMGQGLYTTMSRGMSETYGDFVHTIKNIRTGQNVTAFDADQVITKAEEAAFLEWLRDRPFAWDVLEGYKAAQRTRKSMDEGRDTYYDTFYTRKMGAKGGITWANFFEKTTGVEAKARITEYLEEVKGAGAIKHMGGTTHNEPHQVYIWLHPEDLEVGIDKPVGTGKYTAERRPLLEWMAQQNDWSYQHKNPVPESRIVRFGKRNPMTRELHQTHAQRVAMEKEDGSHFDNPEYDDLLSREQALMGALGLRYTHNPPKGLRDMPQSLREGTKRVLDEAQRPNIWGQDWYRVEDPNRFNEMMEEAYHTNGRLDWARAVEADVEEARALHAEVEEALNSNDFALEEFDAHLDNIGSRIADKLKRDFGTGRTAFVSNGQTYYMPNVFEGHLGRLTRGLTSSAPAMDTLTDAHTAALGLMRHQAAGHVRIQAPAMTPETLKVGTKAHKKAVLYFQRWADLMNNQVANSPVWGPMLKGASDEEIVKFLTENPRGYKHTKEVLEPHESVELYVNEMRAKLDYYLPSEELRRRLAKGPIEPSDLRRKVHNDDLPDIYGPDLTLEDKGFLRKVADNIWNGLGTIPADKFSRQPFAKAVYNQKVRSLLNQSEAEFLDGPALERIHTMAAEHTRQQIKQHLFDLTDGSNMTDALRFIAPFWGAQEEALRKWAHIISDRPETVMRFFNGQRAVYNNLMVVDEENQPVESHDRPGETFFGLGFSYMPTDKVVLQIPDVVRKGPLGKALENIGSIGIPVGSVNTVLQGEVPLLPSFGPWVTIPVDKLMRTLDETHMAEYTENDFYRWMFPIGRPSGGVKGVVDQLVPGWGRRLMGATGEDQAGYFNLYMQMAREMTLRNEQKGLPAPTPEQVESAAKLLWGARTMASFVSPVQMEFRPLNQFWSDEAHRYKREMGADWETKFFEDYGEEAMAYAVSSSHSLAGVAPTSAGINAWDAHKELIAKHADLGGLITGSDTYLDEFNYDVYKMQFEKNLGPGDSRTLREITDPRTRAAEAEESIGWIKFRKVDAAVNAELYARGLTNIQQSGAEDIARYRTEEISKIMREYPAWAIAWNTSERTIYQKVEALKDIASQPEFDNRVDIQGLRDYLAIRDQVTFQLDAGYNGGYASRNLQAQENFALRNWFYTQVGTLIQNNPAFGEVYSRYLSQDTLMQGSGGYGD